MTLVNGLADGQQAVVVRVHHAVADGLAALNTFMIATSEEGGTVAPCPIGELEPVEREELLTNAREESKRLIRDVPGATARFVKGVVNSRRFEDRHLVPQPMESARNSFSTRSGRGAALRECRPRIGADPTRRGRYRDDRQRRVARRHRRCQARGDDRP